MHCPFCSHPETKVIDSRLAGEGTQIRRRRECLGCAERFTTFESAELVMPRVVKRDDSRQPFDDHKLRNGMIRALEKRPVSSEAVEEALARVTHRLQTMGEREVPSRRHWRPRHGGAAGPRRSRLRALRIRLPEFPGRGVIPGRDSQRLRELGDQDRRRDQLSLLPDESS